MDLTVTTTMIMAMHMRDSKCNNQSSLDHLSQKLSLSQTSLKTKTLNLEHASLTANERISSEVRWTDWESIFLVILISYLVKRAIRVLQSPAYEKARTKNALLPPVTDRNSAEAVFKLLPLSLLALRVQKVEEEEEEHEGHTHAKKKRVKGQWNIEVVQQQDTEDDMYYMWLYDGPQWKQRVYALGALVLVMIFVMFPLWPLKLRQGAWYLSMAFFGLIVLFFVMAIFRLILFFITMFSHPPGLWLFPNLFEDVGFVDSFIPLWAWQEVSRL